MVTKKFLKAKFDCILKYFLPVVVVHIGLDVGHAIDLVLEAVGLLAEVLVASNFLFDLVQPFVQVIKIFTSLAEFFLNGLLL